MALSHWPTADLLAARRKGDPFAALPFVVGVIVLVIILALVQRWRARVRRDAFSRFAQGNGFEFDPQPPDASITFASFEPFGKGRRHRTNNRISGRRGRMQWEAFDYQYTTGGGKNSHTSHYGVIVAQTDAHLPRVLIRPEGMLDRVKAVFGSRDVQFENERFNREFYVKSADTPAALDMIGPETMQFLLESPRQFWWQTHAGTIVLLRPKRFEPQEITAMLEMIEGLIRTLPRHLREST